MMTTFATADALFSAAVGESDVAVRTALFRANRALLTDALLSGIAGQAQQLAARGEADRAVQAYSLILEAATTVVETGHLPALEAIVDVSAQAAEFAIAAGKLNHARAVLADARRVARGARSTNAELMILRNLLTVTAAHEPQDWTSATEYALEAARLLSIPATPPREGEPFAPAASNFADVFQALAARAYNAQDYALSANLTRAWRLAAPDDPDATRELAILAMRTGQFAEAEGLWRALVAGAPDDPALLASLAGSLSAQERSADALTPLNRAIELAPDDLPYRRFRAQLRRGSGDLAGAIEDVDHMIAIAGAENPPVRDVLESALLERASLYEQTADLPRALDDLDRVAREADPATAARALRNRIRILARQGHMDLALAALRDAVARVPDDARLALALGQALAEEHNDSEAVDVLSRLVRHTDFAQNVVNLLTPVVMRAPSNVEARRVRGLAAVTAGHPGIATEDFSVVLEQQPSDANLFYRRGRARLMQGESPDDAEWNRSLTPRRVLDAAFDLARAVTLDPTDEDARHGLRWLVDRMCTTERFHPAFYDTTADGMRDIFTVFPTLEQTLQRFWPARDLATGGKYEQALEEWRQMQQALLELAMPVSACRIDTFIADSLLRRFDLQGALEHLDRAGELISLVAQPMLRSLDAEAAESRRQSIRQSGRPAIVIERELGNVYAMFLEDMPERVALLRIDALGRVGDFEEMLRVLDRHRNLEETARPDLVHGQLNIAARLRDAGQPARALALVDRLETITSDPRGRAFLLNLRGSIHLNLQDRKSAEADFKASLEAAHNLPDLAPLTSLNLARVFVEDGRFADARGILASIDGTLPDFVPFEEMTYHWLLAETAFGLDEIDIAATEVETALRLAEAMRGAFQDPGNRIAWQGRLIALYDLALYIAIGRRDVSLLFDLVERTRARAYLDVLRSGVSALPASAKELADSLEAVRARLTILQQMDRTLRVEGATFVDVELVRALERVAPDLTLTQLTSSGRQVMSPSRLEGALADAHQAVAYIEGRIDEERARATAATVGATLNAAAIADLLRAASGAGSETADRAPAIVLVEYFQVRGVVCCLIMRSGEAEPSIHLIELRAADLAAAAAEAAWRESDDGPWQALLSALVAPAVERSKPDELLWIVPYGPIHQMPLHAALVEGVPLLERNPVCHSSSASAMSDSLKRARGTYASAIVFGDAAGDLPFARAESLSVAARFGRQAVVGADATEEALMGALNAVHGRVDVLHLATHGTFDEDDALDSGIDLAGSGGETSRVTARDIVRGQLAVELVTLSACETGRTHVFAGDEPIGLTRAFLSAGAASVVATLWLTNDLATRLIVERFYDALQQPSTQRGERWRKAEALRSAALDIRALTVADLLKHPDGGVAAIGRSLAAARKLRDSDAPFAATRYWAPFALVGAWT